MCLPFVCRLAMFKPTLMAIVSPSDHVSTIKLAFHPAAIAATSSAAPGVPRFSHCKSCPIFFKKTLQIVKRKGQDVQRSKVMSQNPKAYEKFITSR